jgi:adenosylmethionine-8-amino-7-oxononanoate aminotransferase
MFEGDYQIHILLNRIYMASELLNQDQLYVWHPFTQMLNQPIPLGIVKAKDCSLIAEDGKIYLDCNSSWWVNIHGHGHPYLKEALINQFDEIDHVIFAGVTHPKAVELSSKILKVLPKSLSKVFFSDDGSTAVEVALKMAFQYWHNKQENKKRIVAIEGAYHGDTFGAMSISQRGYFNQPFEHLFFDVDYLDFPSKVNEDDVLIEAQQLFQTNEIAAIIVEPLIQGSAGMRMYSSSFLDRLVDLAKSANVLVIFDEVMTGWGRTGRLFAMDYLEEKPDIVCLSKGLTGGVIPLGLTITSDKIYEAFLAEEKTKALLHGHSFTGNALACAVASANLDLVVHPSFDLQLKRISKQHRFFAEKIKGHKNLKEVRQLGTIIAFEIKLEETSSYFSSIRDKAYEFFLSKGLLIRPLGNIVFLNPPYCTTNNELELMYKGIEEFLNLIDFK